MILWGSMACFDKSAFDAYVNGGGGIVGTAGIFSYAPTQLDSLPGTLAPGSGAAIKWDIPTYTVIDANDVLLQGVTLPPYAQGDVVYYETASLSLRPGAVGPAYADQTNEYVISRAEYGQGRATYTILQYVDQSNPWAYDWAKQLIYNAVLWTAKMKS